MNAIVRPDRRRLAIYLLATNRETGPRSSGSRSVSGASFVACGHYVMRFAVVAAGARPRLR
jgi:hypothetical protein